MKEVAGHEPEKEKNAPGRADTGKIIRHHLLASMGVGLVPIPFIDLAGITGIQLNLIRKLARVYNTPFSKDLVKNCLGALIGGVIPVSAGAGIGGSLAKFVPVFGHAAGAVSVSAVAGAFTYAVGKVFNRHFSEGGTLLSFDPEKVKSFYEEMFKEGQEVSKNIKKG